MNVVNLGMIRDLSGIWVVGRKSRGNRESFLCNEAIVLRDARVHQGGDQWSVRLFGQVLREELEKSG